MTTRTRAKGAPPPLTVFTEQERRLIRRLDTPAKVQRFLNNQPYNSERGGETLHSFREVVRHGRGHCAESAVFAACILEQHGYPPLILSIESVDWLDHVIFLYRQNGLWGTIARSRDPGLHGRKAAFRTIRALVMSYFDPYIDATEACVEGYATIDLRELKNIDWRFSKRNLWALERALTDLRHTKINLSRARFERTQERYVAYQKKYRRKPLFYVDRPKWSEIPREFL